MSLGGIQFWCQEEMFHYMGMLLAASTVRKPLKGPDLAAIMELLSFHPVRHCFGRLDIFDLCNKGQDIAAAVDLLRYCPVRKTNTVNTPSGQCETIVEDSSKPAKGPKTQQQCWTCSATTCCGKILALVPQPAGW